MRRRDIVAGIGSAGALAGAGGFLWRGLPTLTSDEPASTDDGDDHDPLEFETIDARGSEAGTLSVDDGTVTAAMFFATSCGHCKSQVAPLVEARHQLEDEYGDAVRVLGASLDSDELTPPDELRDWWETHGGDGPVGYSAGLSRAYGVIGYPSTIVVDTAGEKRWDETDVLTSREIVRAVEGVLEDEGIEPEADEDDATDDAEAAAGDDAADEETESDSADANGTADDA